ncbi:MAG: YegS/Rv2252/BmrU family lipid kinase [Clostridia bacterium]|nr:YegS/Rv2252/BmrU family lipid kinase [Clostridia bacterium]
MNRKALLIINPCSGRRQGVKYLVDILNMFDRAGYSISLHLTAKRLDATRLAEEFGPASDLIVCIGGDGTFNEVIVGMMRGKVRAPIGYIPLGSTNDFASSLNIPKHWRDAVFAILNGAPKAIDICRFNERYFSYVASCGAFAKTSYSTPQNLKNALGHLAYILEGAKDISAIRPLGLKIELPDETIEGEFIFAACSNATTVGGVLRLDPKLVDMNDGKMELMLIPSPNNALHFGKVLQCLQTKKYEAPYVIFKSSPTAEIYTDGTFDWSLDGEKYTGSKKISAAVEHSAISIILA